MTPGGEQRPESKNCYRSWRETSRGQKLLVGFTFFNLFFWWDWCLNSGLWACRAGTLQFEPYLYSILLRLSWRWAFLNYLHRLASYHDPPISASQVSMITGMSHWHLLLWLFWRLGLVNYLPGLSSYHDPPDLSLLLARITGRSHWQLCWIYSLLYSSTSV
jgi:hypothetical protein